MADERRLLDTTRAVGDDTTSAGARSGGLGTVLLALLARLLGAARPEAAAEESASMAV